MSYGMKRFPWLALGLMAVIGLSQVALSQADDLVPVGYWALDDGQTDPFTTTALDSSASGNNGTLWNFPSQPTWGAGAYGGALKFDGTDDRVDMGNPLDLDITGALSMSLWMGRLGPNATSYATLVGKNFSGGSTDDAYYVNSTSDSHIVFGITPDVGDTVQLTSSTIVPSGTWHHVTTTFDPGNRMAIYLDGVLDSELTMDVPTEIRSVTSPFTLGNLGAGSSSNAYCLNGYLDEVYVFNGVLGETQITTLATPPSVTPGDPTTAVLIAHWDLDDGQTDPFTTTALDDTGTPSNGTLVNFDTPPSWDDGIRDGALYIDGANDRVDMGTSTKLDNISGDLSMAFWMKPTGRGPKKYGSLLGKNLSGGPEEDAYFADIVYDRSVTDAAAPAGTIEFGITADGVNYVVRSNTTLSLDDDTWHLVAVTYDDGSRMAIYIDGELDSELTIDVPEACATPFFTPFALGNLSAGSSTDQYCYNGFLDDVEVYTGVLTAQEVLDIWNRVSRIPGDATGDGIVDEADAQQLAQNWGAGTPGDPATWAMGNFDDDDFVGPKDAAILAANWGYPGESESAAVPEPTMLSLLAGAVLLAAYVRRRPR